MDRARASTLVGSTLVDQQTGQIGAGGSWNRPQSPHRSKSSSRLSQPTYRARVS
jgi:hypothetical protein